MIKTYVAKRKRVLSYPIVIKGIINTIKFTGGDPPVRLSTFQTSDPILQNAIENNPAYGDKFELQRGQKLGQPAKKPMKKVKIGNSVVTEQLHEEKIEKPKKEEKPIVGNDITSGQKAKKFLLDQKELEGKITSKMLQNNAKIIQTAKSLNVIFPNWEQFNE